MVEKVRLGGDPIPEYGLRQNIGVPEIVQPSRPVTAEEVKQGLSTFVAVVFNYTQSNVIGKAREAVIKHLRLGGTYSVLDRRREARSIEEGSQDAILLGRIEAKIQEQLEECPEFYEMVRASRVVQGKDEYYLYDWTKAYLAVQSLCEALRWPVPRAPAMSRMGFSALARDCCDKLAVNTPPKTDWQAAKAVTWYAYNMVYHWYKALPREAVTEQLNEAVKALDKALSNLKINLDWE